MRYFSSVCIALLCLLTSCGQLAQKETAEKTTTDVSKKGTAITLTGTFRNAQKTKVLLKKFVNEDYVVVDSTTANGKDFKFTVNLEEAEFFKLFLFDNLEISLVLNPKQPKVKILFANQDAENRYEVEGSDDSMHYITLNALYADFRNKIADFQQADVKATSKEAKAQIQAEYATYQTKSIKQLKALIDTIQPSIVGLVGIESLDYKAEKVYIEKVFENYEKQLPNSTYTKRFAQRLAQARAQATALESLSEGRQAPDIALESPKGDIVKLSSLRGKVVLIDFWASWCKPCRMENPNVVRLHKQYKDKGFEVYSVSLDTKRDAWLKAIQEDGLAWQHVIETDQNKTGVATSYKVESIPTTYLLDKEGKIIASNLRGEALENKLAAVLN